MPQCQARDRSGCVRERAVHVQDEGVGRSLCATERAGCVRGEGVHGFLRELCAGERAVCVRGERARGACVRRELYA
jgi:hypothetical protein